MKTLFAVILVLGLALVLIGCGGTATTAPTAAPTNQPTASAPPDTVRARPVFEPQVVEGGQVTVEVTPRVIEPGAPLEFEIALDTHSVELDYDLVKLVVLRDEAGQEYAPQRWDGAGGGGHHRAGVLAFAPLKGDSKTLTLIVKDVAGVPERVFRWSF